MSQTVAFVLGRWLAAFLVCLATAAIVQAEEIPAFPGVEGAGATTTGGRGGAVYHVTTLKPDGPGSLGEAVSQPNRIVVFDISGIIDLNADKDGKKEKEGKKKVGKIHLDQPNITIAGQTAPGEGICLKGGALDISAGNIIVRYLRSRRGWNFEGDMGDAINVKPGKTGEQTVAAGQTNEAFTKRQIKKESRGKAVHEYADIAHIVIDHCSTSWATDENLTVTHVDQSTVSWSIAAEGCDYANPKQTPPNHSEGSLWGSAKADGRATMHHMLYAHNRLRNPRTTGGDDIPAVLNFYNSVVYNWSEYPSHTGMERVLLNWLNSYYKPGPDTPADVRDNMFQFHGDPGARIFAQGNFIDGSPAATANNKLAISHNKKFAKVSEADREAMKVDKPFADAPTQIQSAQDAYDAVLDGAGATLPARDAVDLRIARSVRTGTGKIIEKETDLPLAERWPDYRTLPPPLDTDRDGMPDFWERQFGLDPKDAADSNKISAGGYANIEHYFNSTDPTGGSTPIVFVAAAVSRAKPNDPGQWRVMRNGDAATALTIKYSVAGEAKSGTDFAPLSGSVTIPAGQRSAPIALQTLVTARDNQMVVITLATDAADYHVGCPAQSLIVIRK